MELYWKGYVIAFKTKLIHELAKKRLKLDINNFYYLYFIIKNKCWIYGWYMQNLAYKV